MASWSALPISRAATIGPSACSSSEPARPSRKKTGNTAKAVLITGGALLATHAQIFEYFLTAPTLVRILISVALIFPLGFFLGMPFPLGILGISDQPSGAIPWAWGLNGVFTVVGGFLSVVLSLLFGFKATLAIALLIYCLAFVVFRRIRGVALVTSA